MGKKGRLRPKHRRDGERRMAARWERSEPVLAFQPPQEWRDDAEDVEAFEAEYDECSTT